jgi:hypothetical protein
MSPRHTTQSLVVRERFSFWPHFGAGLAAFLVTALTVHFFAQHGLRQAESRRALPVQVRVDVPGDLLAGIREIDSPNAVKTLSNHFRRPELLRQVWQEFTAKREGAPGLGSAKTPASCEQFTSSLRVEGKPTAGGCRFDLQLDSPQPQEAAEYLKALARRFVQECQGGPALWDGRQLLLAQEEFRQAETEYREAQERLGRFDEEYLRQDSEGGALQRAVLAEIHRQLQREYEEADAKCLRKKEAVQTVGARSIDLPSRAIQVFLPAQSGPRSEGGFRLLGLSLGSALTMAVGVCFISLGAALEPLVARLADLERLLTVPILGIVPRRDSDDSSGKRGRRRGVCRLALFFSGLFLVFGATAAIMVVVYRCTVS